MDWNLFAQLVVTALVAIAAAWLTHTFASRRDAAGDQRKLRIQYLLEAYRSLERAESLEDGPPRWRVYENAAADIQLLGSKEQVELVRIWMSDFTTTQTGNLTPVLESLRKSLRRELHLEAVAGPIVFLRIRPRQRVSPPSP